MYCPNCGSKQVTQMTRMIIVMQLPGAAVNCSHFSCDKCITRWFMERDTLQDEISTCDLCGNKAGFNTMSIHNIDGEPKLLCPECHTAQLDVNIPATPREHLSEGETL